MCRHDFPAAKYHSLPLPKRRNEDVKCGECRFQIPMTPNVQQRCIAAVISRVDLPIWWSSVWTKYFGEGSTWCGVARQRRTRIEERRTKREREWRTATPGSVEEDEVGRLGLPTGTSVCGEGEGRGFVYGWRIVSSRTRTRPVNLSARENRAASLTRSRLESNNRMRSDLGFAPCQM